LVAGVALLAVPAGLESVTGRQHSTDLWLAPAVQTSSSPLARGVTLLEAEHAAEALPLLRSATSDPVLGGYAEAAVGRAQLALDEFSAAGATAERLLAARPVGHLEEVALWLAVEAAEGEERWADAVRWLQALTAADPSDPAGAYDRLGEAAIEAGNESVAADAYQQLYESYPISSAASEAAAALESLDVSTVPTRETFAAADARAERLFAARRYRDARTAFRALRPLASGEAGARIDLRLAQTEFHLGRYTTAHRAIDPLVDGSAPEAVRAEAAFYHLSILRQARRHTDYRQEARAFLDEFPDHPFAARTLDELGTHYILEDEDATAADIFAELYRAYPSSSYAGRAAWKSGWWAYKAGDYAMTVETFESAVGTVGRVSYRSWWLYWAARAHMQLGDRDRAIAGYRRTIADYRNSYYGRLAVHQLEALLAPGARPVSPTSLDLPSTITPGRLPSNATLVEALLSVGLYEDALGELYRAERAEGPSSVIEATRAYALNRIGRLRPAITAMRRAYPEFMATGGEALPREILTVIFPVDHWDLIRKYADAHDLDPFLMTALIAQESTFQADVRSPANAWGLMQVLPRTGRRVAGRLGIRPFTTWRLTEPEVNIRIGMRYFKDLITEFGDPVPALAAYNAGESRVRLWRRERPTMAVDEFIDDIPFPETMNYIKRVMGTAEDYRLLYEDLAPGSPVGGDR
jgi:soluble lytic murein transglycosylase